MGYEVTTAGNAEEATCACRERKFDLLLSDVVMPGKWGTELAQSVAEQHAADHIILMTGYTDDARISEFVAGLPDVKILPKPFCLEALLAAISAELHPSRLPKQAASFF
jgi:DNA-binding NtrC family response regulator